MGKRQSAAAAVLLIFTAAVCMIADNPPLSSVIGAFAAAGTAAALSLYLRLPDRLYYLILVFVFLASPVGSVIDMYRIWQPYDKIVHFASGILLAAAAFEIFKKLWGNDKGNTMHMSFAFLFSSACAGMWEIFEFAADRLTGGDMQRGMVDTVTDMIAGNAGAVCFVLITAFIFRRGK